MVAELSRSTVQARPVTGTEGIAGRQVGAITAFLGTQWQSKEKTEKEGLKLHARFQV